MQFTRVSGAGNTFLLVDLRDRTERDTLRAITRIRAAATSLCSAGGPKGEQGVDGLLVVAPARGTTDATMVVVNRDGSRPEMCGNGLRCVAAFVARRGGDRTLRVATDVGPLTCEVIALDGADAMVRVDMGPLHVIGEATPRSGGGRRFIGVSTGNPHAVCFVDRGEDPEQLARALGPSVENDAVYAPEKTNVGFARIATDGSVQLAVWERGVGWTPACGTGACAAVFAAVREGLAPPDRDVRVVVSGGTLTVCVPVDPNVGVLMTGPARELSAAAIEIA